MEKMFLKVSDVMKVLDVSESYAYKLIRKLNKDVSESYAYKLNKELENKGCFVIAGRIDRKFFYEHFYGTQKGSD